MSDKKPQKLNKLLDKINGVDNQITTLTKKLQDIKRMFQEHCDSDEEEVCPDVDESDKAVVRAIEEMFIEELLTREPEGEA